MRRILTFIISIFLILTCSATTLLAEYTEANGQFTIEISGESGHTYQAYQIFKGDLATNGAEKVLSNIAWGNGVTSTAQTEFGDAEIKARSLDESSTKAFAHQLASNASYYLTNPISISYDSANSKYSVILNEAGYYLIVEDSTKAYYIGVSENKAITLKHDNKPTITKQVHNGSSWTIAADAGISDEVKFKISISLPEASVYDLYTAYSLEIEDTLPTGLTYKTDSLKVYKKDETTSVSTGYILDTTDASKLKISISDTKVSPFNSLTGGKSLRIEYTAVLNKNATLGSTGNTNSVILKYSNNPSDPGSRGTTATSSSIVYTYGMDIEKVDDANNAVKLSNAKFKLFKKDGANKYYAKADTNYCISGWTDVDTNGTEFVSDASGKIEVKGLDKGEYYLTETKAPVGYNNVSGDMKVVIESTVENSMGTLTGLTITVNSESSVSGNVDSGIVSMTVKNKKGNILPSTGGIGTTIFYVAGGVLVAGAAVLLMLKRKER